MGYSGAGGKLIHKKNQKQKISWHCPFKAALLAACGEDPSNILNDVPAGLPAENRTGAPTLRQAEALTT